jgi:hypothetical protein
LIECGLREFCHLFSSAVSHLTKHNYLAMFRV